MCYIAQAGDVLLYRHAPSIDTRLIQVGEILEDGREANEYYHVSIALDCHRKIEAAGKTVVVTGIDYGNFDAFRPPLKGAQIETGLDWACECLGEPYDWSLIIDDGLRYLTRNLIHLPVSWIRSEERKKKICSSLVAGYFKAAKWGPEFRASVSPEDIYNTVKPYRVT